MSGPPPSATRFPLTLTALATGLAAVWLTGPGRRAESLLLAPYTLIIPCLSIVTVMVVAEWWLPVLRPGAPRPARSARPLDWRRVIVRLWAFAATLGLVAFAYWLLPEYSGTFYDPYWRFLRALAPLAVLIPGYFLWADIHGEEQHDDYLAFGGLLTGRWRGADWRLIRRHLLGWAVKAFFLPLMVVYLDGELRALDQASSGASVGTLPLYHVLYHASYTVDLLFSVVGYSVSTRLFDTHVRSVEPTVAGWAVALMCYQPFYSVIGRFYLQYDDATYWDNWLSPWPWVRAVWAGAIVLLLSVYALCTVSFGLRFSNLTHRGIITGGPYRFSKHPAYLAKNLSWWLISVPFVSELGAGVAIRNCCLLALVNLLYYARARTEERHLSRDPTYRAYALWINERGLLRGVGRVLPVLRYRVPEKSADFVT